MKTGAHELLPSKHSMHLLSQVKLEPFVHVKLLFQASK